MKTHGDNPEKKLISSILNGKYLKRLLSVLFEYLERNDTLTLVS